MEMIKPIEFVDKYQESPIEIFDRKKCYEGCIFTSNRGEKVRLVEYIDGHHSTVESLITGNRHNTRISSLLNGNFCNNIIADKVYPGQRYKNNYSEEYEIVNIIDANNIMIKFIESEYYKSVPYSCIRKGTIYNPYRLNKYGGYMGNGPYNYTNSKQAYKIWNGILIRSKNKNKQSCHISYENVYLSDEWLDFQNFAMWYNYRYNTLNPNFNYDVDKDIKQSYKSPGEIKYYSKETCMLIPSKLNHMFVSMINGNRKIVNKDIPLGVTKNPSGTFSIRLSNGKTRTYTDKYEAFLDYKKSRTELVMKTAKYYLDNNALFKDDYFWIIMGCINLSP